MADEKPAEGGEEAAAEKPKKKLEAGTLLALVNTLAVLGALGMAVYTKILYKKPVIQEKQELEKIVAEEEKDDTPEEKPVITFDQMTINIAPTNKKIHYATMALNIEARNVDAAGAVKASKAILTDKFIELLSKKNFADLNTIQGKLILKTELIRKFNEILKQTADVDVGVTDVFFSEFVLQ